MAASVNWGSVKARVRAPLKGFGVEKGRLRADPFESYTVIFCKVGVHFLDVLTIRALLFWSILGPACWKLPDAKGAYPPECTFRLHFLVLKLRSDMLASKHGYWIPTCGSTALTLGLKGDSDCGFHALMMVRA